MVFLTSKVGDAFQKIRYIPDPSCSRFFFHLILIKFCYPSCEAGWQRRSVLGLVLTTAIAYNSIK